jgi:hypothetical protein
MVVLESKKRWWQMAPYFLPPAAGSADPMLLSTYTLQIPDILATIDLADQTAGPLILSVSLPSLTPNINKDKTPTIPNSPLSLPAVPLSPFSSSTNFMVLSNDNDKLQYNPFLTSPQLHSLNICPSSLSLSGWNP